MSRRYSTGVLMLLLAAVLWLDAATAQACPMCKEALAATEQGANLVRGFFWSILFMMAMPFTILGAFCGSMYLAVRRARAAQADTAGGANASSDQAEVDARCRVAPITDDACVPAL